MSNIKSMEIKRSKDGAYYTLFINGLFAGNYDTVHEAIEDYEKQVEAETLAVS